MPDLFWYFSLHCDEKYFFHILRVRWEYMNQIINARASISEKKFSSFACPILSISFSWLNGSLILSCSMAQRSPPLLLQWSALLHPADPTACSKDADCIVAAALYSNECFYVIYFIVLSNTGNILISVYMQNRFYCMAVCITLVSIDAGIFVWHQPTVSFKLW